MTKIGELVLLSILWFVCSLPVVTIGTSTAALYYAVTKCLRMGRGYVFKEYFKAWKQNFLRGSFLSLVFVVALLLLWTVLMTMGYRIEDIVSNGVSSIWKNESSETVGVYFAAAIYLILLGALFNYVFPLLSRFDMNILRILALAFVMMIRFFYYSLAMLVILCLMGLMVYHLPLGIMFAPGLWAFLNSFLVERAMRKYTPEPSPDEDAWWMRL